MTPRACVCEPPFPRPGNDDVHSWKCPLRNAAGLLCAAHFRRTPSAMHWEAEECADCQRARREAEERLQAEHTIDPSQPYGVHVSLTCRNHPHLAWHTKNIDYIGARSIFYGTPLQSECECPAADLMLAPRPPSPPRA